MRNWFVGALFVVGLFLYLYKGFSRMENYLLNAAGLLAVCVAVKPMPWPDIEQPKTVLLDFFAKLGVTQHGTYAVAFFLCIAIVSHFCADNTLYLVENKAHRAWYKRTYSFISMAMIVSILAAYVLNLVLPYSTWLFAAETLGIEAFAAYWLVKSKELKESSAEPRALALQLKRMNGRLNASSVSN